MKFPIFCVALGEKLGCRMTSQLMNKLRRNLREEEEEKNDCKIPVFVEFSEQIKGLEGP